MWYLEHALAELVGKHVGSSSQFIHDILRRQRLLQTEAYHFPWIVCISSGRGCAAILQRFCAQRPRILYPVLSIQVVPGVRQGLL
jgi:hypothetical protein